MANCPKCNKKIPIYHIGQNCPHCGVNVRFYDFEKQFYHDAKEAELSNAKISVFIAKLKASLIGGKLQIIRLCFLILPLAALFAPFANVGFVQPFLDESVSISGLGFYLAFTGGYMDYCMGMIKSVENAEAFKWLIISLAGYVLVVLVTLVIIFMTILAFCSVKKAHRNLCVTSIIGCAFSVATAILVSHFSTVAKNVDGIISVKASFGAAAFVLAFGAIFAVNFLIGKKGLNIQYKEGDLERCEIAKKVKSGEIKLDDLPQPIVETAETRKIDEEIAAQQETYRKKEEEGVIK